MMRKLMPVLVVLLLAGCGAGPLGHHRVVAATSCSGYQTQYGCQAHSEAFGLPPKNATLRATALPPTSTATKLQLDSTDVGTFSGLNVQAAAGYTAGHWPTYFAMVARYPDLLRQHLLISINIAAHYHGSCLDVEPGDGDPSQSTGWVQRDFIAGFSRPCIYANLSTMPAVKANLRSGGLKLCSSSTQTHCVLLWDADWTFGDHVDAGYACTQWTDHYLNRNIDASRCVAWFYQAQAPPPPPAPRPPHSSFNRQFDSGFQRAFTVHWDKRHHRAAPRAHALVFGPGFNPGFGAGWRAVR